MSWEDITDEAKGFIKNDTVIFEVSLILLLFTFIEYFTIFTLLLLITYLN